MLSNTIPKNLKVGDLVMIGDWSSHCDSLEDSKWEKWTSEVDIAACAVGLATGTETAMATGMATATGLETETGTETVINNKTNTEYNIKYWGEDWKLVSDNKIVAIVNDITKEEHPDHDIIHLFCQDELIRYVRRMELEGCTDD
jgi:co-chaperonin GroES (HSP10)